VFQMDIEKVDRDITYGCTYMLQRSITDVSSVFSYVCRKCVYLDVACVLFGCCVCLQRFSSVFRYFFSSVSETRCKCVFQIF
jgi:hypothetical protein